MATFSPHMDKPNSEQRPYNPAKRNVSQCRTHAAAATWKDVTIGVASITG